MASKTLQQRYYRDTGVPTQDQGALHRQPPTFSTDSVCSSYCSGFRLRFSRDQRRHERISVFLTDHVNQGIPQLPGTSLGNHSFRPTVKDHGNTRLKINNQRTAILIPDIQADSPHNIQPLALFRQDQGQLPVLCCLSAVESSPKSQPDKIARNRHPATRGIAPDDLPLLVGCRDREMQRTRSLAAAPRLLSSSQPPFQDRKHLEQAQSATTRQFLPQHPHHAVAVAEHPELFPLFPGSENQRMPVRVIGQCKIENVARNRLSSRLEARARISSCSLGLQCRLRCFLSLTGSHRPPGRSLPSSG